jgi:hypothetical protein
MGFVVLINGCIGILPIKNNNSQAGIAKKCDLKAGFIRKYFGRVIQILYAILVP